MRATQHSFRVCVLRAVALWGASSLPFSFNYSYPTVTVEVSSRYKEITILQIEAAPRLVRNEKRVFLEAVKQEVRLVMRLNSARVLITRGALKEV